ncbi:MAG: hypothetical protein ACXAD7_23010 [Candidatus Kariarchaeaceae archaeon]|jgi:hypothetical protein
MPFIHTNDEFNSSDIKTNYYLSSDEYYNDLFLSKIIDTNNNSSFGPAVKKLYDYSNFPAIAYSISEMGPKELYRDFNKLPLYSTEKDEELDAFLLNLGVQIMVGLARGHSYNEGVFELPANIPEHRIMAICVRYKNNDAVEDQRLVHGYLQLGIFMPRDVLRFLPSFSSFEDEILTIVKSHLTQGKFREEHIGSIKYSVMRLLEFIIKQHKHDLNRYV